jgi:NADPH:quinone reductase-like Zn-dependent oxidoreductase
VLLVSARATKDDLLFMQAMVTEGKVTPAIDRTYLLADAVEALSYFERGEAVGKIVITVS